MQHTQCYTTNDVHKQKNEEQFFCCPEILSTEISKYKNHHQQQRHNNRSKTTSSVTITVIKSIPSTCTDINAVTICTTVFICFCTTLQLQHDNVNYDATTIANCFALLFGGKITDMEEKQQQCTNKGRIKHSLNIN